jgi:hypothetical protein
MLDSFLTLSTLTFPTLVASLTDCEILSASIPILGANCCEHFAISCNEDGRVTRIDDDLVTRKNKDETQQLHGYIPLDIGNLTEITHFVLEFTKIEGGLPASIIGLYCISAYIPRTFETERVYNPGFSCVWRASPRDWKIKQTD